VLTITIVVITVVVKKKGKGYQLRTKSGKRLLGKHKTKAGAKKQERAIHAAKAARRKRGKR
tara:strand:+ start:248 stop:430 length:183 start_codon:yes stop_codon:yes gene_type:complete